MATGRGGPRIRLPEGSPVSASPRRQEVAALPLAGGGATGGRIRLDPAQFRDEIRRSRNAGTAITVAGDIHETLTGLDVSPTGTKTKRAALQQFSANLQRVAIESSRAPGENLLEPYRQAFAEFVKNDPEKAAVIFEASKLPPETVSELGGSGFRSLMGQDPQRLLKAMEAARMRPEVVRALLAAPERPKPAAAAGYTPVPYKPDPTAGYKPVPLVDVDPVIPAQPTRTPVPIGKGDIPKILIEPGADWTKDQIARGWRSVTYAPGAAQKPAAPTAPRGDTRVASIYLEREQARLQSQLMQAGGPNSPRGKRIKAVLDDYDALRQSARASAEAELQEMVAQRQATLASAKSSDEVANSQYRLKQARTLLADHMASFDALSRPAAAGPSPSADTASIAPTNVVEVLAGRWGSDLKPTKATPEIPNPGRGAERVILEPERPVAETPLKGLRRDVADAAESPQAVVARLTPEQREALERAQDLSAALKTGRQIALGQEVAPNQVEGMQQVPLAGEIGLFDDTQQAREITRAIAGIVRKHPVIAGLIDAGPAVAPAPRGPLAAMDRGDFRVSLSNLLGGWDGAKPFFFEDRPSNVPPAIKPLIKQAENVAALERITGQPFVPQLPADSSTVGALNKGVTPEDLPKGYAQMTPSQKRRVLEDLESTVEGSVGERAQFGVNADPGVSQALKLIDENIPFAKGKRRIDLDSLEEKYPEVVAEIRKIMASSDERFGGPVILKNQTTIDTRPEQRRSMLATGRGKLTRLREQLESIVEGKTKFIPTVLRERRALSDLSDKPADPKAPAKFDPWAAVEPKYRAIRKQTGMEFVQRMLQQGGIFPLDEHASYWRGKFLFLDPDDGNVYYGRLTPGVLARTIAQQLVLENPAKFRQLTDMVRRSMEVYERLPATEAASQFLDQNGAPRAIAPTKTYLNTLVQLFESQGKPFQPIIRLNPLEDAPAPPQGKRRFVPVSPLIGLNK
jgi:hypothetical protein